MNFRGAWGEANEIIKKLDEESKETCNFSKFSWIMRKFFINKTNFIKFKVTLMVYWNSLIILNEFKKPSGKLLRVLAKNHLDLKFLRKFLNLHTKISTESLSDLLGPLSFYTALENNTIFYNNFSVSGDLPPLRAALLRIPSRTRLLNQITTMQST